MKRAREQAQREKRELKQAKKDARAAARLEATDPTALSQVPESPEVSE
jgi:hypothetical protein